MPALAQTGDRDSDAGASPDRPVENDLDRLTAATLAEIDQRIGTLDRLREVVLEAQRLVPDHRTMLTDQLAASVERLVDLRRAVSDAETLGELGTLIPRIVSENWVYGLTIPKVHEVLASDAIVSIIADLEAVHGRVGRVLERADQAGVDVAEARASLEQARVAGAQARALAAPVSEAVLPIAPADMPEGGADLVRAAEDLRLALGQLTRSAAATRVTLTHLRGALDQSET